VRFAVGWFTVSVPGSASHAASFWTASLRTFMHAASSFCIALVLDSSPRSPPAVTAESGEAQLPPLVSLAGAREDDGEESFPSLQSGYRRIACLQSVSCMSESCAAAAKRKGTESGVSGPRLFIC
jgi:hypothetical protein